MNATKRNILLTGIVTLVALAAAKLAFGGPTNPSLTIISFVSTNVARIVTIRVAPQDTTHINGLMPIYSLWGNSTGLDVDGWVSMVTWFGTNGNKDITVQVGGEECYFKLMRNQ